MAEIKLKIIIKKFKKKVLTKGKRGDIIAELSQGSEKQIAERTAWYLENRIVKQNKT